MANSDGRSEEAKLFFKSLWNWLGIVVTIIGLIYIPEWWPALILIVPVLALVSRTRWFKHRLEEKDLEMAAFRTDFERQLETLRAENAALKARRSYNDLLSDAVRKKLLLLENHERYMIEDLVLYGESERGAVARRQKMSVDDVQRLLIGIQGKTDLVDRRVPGGSQVFWFVKEQFMEVLKDEIANRS